MIYLKTSLMACILVFVVACASKPEHSILEGEMFTVLERGVKELHTGKLNRAFGSYKNALVLAQVRGDENKAAEIKISIGSIALLLKDYEQAEVYFTEANTFGHTANQQVLSLHAAIGLGNLYFQQKKYQQSKQKFSYVINTIADNNNYLQSKIRALNGLAVNLRVEGVLKQALSKVDLCVELSKDNNLQQLLADSLYNKASILFYGGEMNLSKDSAMQALALDKTLERLPSIARDYELLANIEEKMNNDTLSKVHYSNAEVIRKYLNQ